MGRDAPIDFAIGILNAVLSALMFIGVLWFIGGTLTIEVGSTTDDGIVIVPAREL